MERLRIKYLGFGFFLVTAGLAVWPILKFDLPQGWNVAILVGVIGNAIFNLAKGFWSKLIYSFFADENKLRNLSKKEFSESIKKILETEISTLDRQNQNLAVDTNGIKTLLKKQWIDQFDNFKTANFSNELAQKYLELKKKSEELEKLNKTYMGKSTTLYETYRTFFSNSESNIAQLNIIAAEIKNKAIEPSFTHLEQVQECLSDASQSVDSVKF